MKRICSLLIVVTLAVSACATAPQTEIQGVTFIHLNDTYRVGAVEDGKAGGFSRVVTVVRELQEQGRDVRILHGGDFLYPSLESQLWDGLQIVDAFNFMDAVAPLYAVAGNHEFDRRGPQQLIDAVLKETGASSMKDMGKVMGQVKGRAQGRADMGAVSAKIKARLAGPG